MKGENKTFYWRRKKQRKQKKIKTNQKKKNTNKDNIVKHSIKLRMKENLTDNKH